MNKKDKIELRSEEFQEVLGDTPPWMLRWGIILIALIVVVFLTGSALIKYPDVISSRIILTGSIPPAAVTARATGKLNQLFVRDNQTVHTGDYLAVIDNPARTEDVLKLKAFMEGFAGRDAINCVSTLPPQDLQLGTLQTTYSNFYITLFNYLEYNRLLYYPKKIQIMKDRILQYEEQYQNLQRQQTLTKEQFLLNQSQFRRDSVLFSTGVISQEELEKSQNSYLQSKLSEESMRSTLNNMRIQIAQLKEQLLDAGHQDTETLNGLQTQLQSLITQLKTDIQSWEINYVLMAPISGKITFTEYWISNQNVSAGEAVFTIIPTEDVRVIGKASLPVARSGKVKAGQKVNIRLENFPENEFGILRGTVQTISLVPTQAGNMTYYTVEIDLPDKLTTTYRKELPFLPNMQGQADIITDDISLLERLVLPIKKILRESV
ncbi:hemolysin [Bacteroidia bacterium]|nr:hemolysin [Bacteroidia bacterium]